MDVLQKVEELKKKIEELQQGAREGALAVPSKGKHFSLDFVESEDIREIESGIRETLSGITLSKAALCKALANIDKKRLYTQVGAKNFMEYLEMARIPINYKTAKEYAKIGDTMLRYDSELTSVDFREEDGLKKLVYLDKALEQCSEDRETVFQKVKESSLRDFQQWIKEMGETEAEEDGPIEGDETSLTVDQSGRPLPELFFKGNTLCKKTGPRSFAEMIVVKPEEFGFDYESREWKYFLRKIQELAESLYRETTGENG